MCSNYLADVKPGDELVMTGPAGTALLLADNPWNKRIVCVSTGGTGAETQGLCKTGTYFILLLGCASFNLQSCNLSWYATRLCHHGMTPSFAVLHERQ